MKFVVYLVKSLKITGANWREITLLCAIALLISLGACSSAEPKKPFNISPVDVDLVLPPAGTASMDPDTINEILAAIEERNSTIESDPKWIERSYAGLMVRRLTNVSESEFKLYRKYLDKDESVYILVHPGFFSFFHYPRKVRDNDPDKLHKENVVELLLQKKATAPEFALLQAQERRMRDFIEFKSTEEKLLIIIIPRNYQEYPGYTYRRGRDEYMRFLNEITNFSKSVLFIESRSPNRGYLRDDDAERLMEFLLSIKAKNIYIGGGYIGRCLEDFYALITEEYGKDGIYVVPELSDISPRELNESIASDILTSDGRINTAVATRLMKQDTYKVQESMPKILNLK